MSRTYRHRHLLSGRGVARKFVDSGCCYWRTEDYEEAYRYLVHDVLGAPCVFKDSSIPCRVLTTRNVEDTHQKCAWNAGLHVSYKSVRHVAHKLGLVPSVLAVNCHPVVKWWIGPNAHRTAECRRGHQAIRAHARKINDSFRGDATQVEDLWLDLEKAYKHTRYEIDPWDWD